MSNIEMNESKGQYALGNNQLRTKLKTIVKIAVIIRAIGSVRSEENATKTAGQVTESNKKLSPREQ